ncbi:dihydrofolate reductase-like domain-containing protein [Tricharina praecox]|uniref:dihydrofolate reductase-like domain-containing protein n=1 Tax=Tricharina praecox TaxID=43433 RepID=UPI00221E9383|nr:dihydrofolate reductase-like domain-containing protein [Tricharina praecox]KAI5848222.1 dihydrofolate reductase-like domain-containing protein [Tricharina praecox]
MTTPKPLTLIVAATGAPTLGIGRNGALPWRLKSELSYFARVTKRLPGGSANTASTAQNAVIMGRKTWFSIPPRFRPLPGRINVVLSRDAALDLGVPGGAGAGATTATSVDDALAKLVERGEAVGTVFVIGGAEVYKAALLHPLAQNVLLTRIDTEFEVDTIFPVQLTAEGSGWAKASWEALCKFVGEEVPKGVQKEEGVKFEYELWQKQKADDE